MNRPISPHRKRKMRHRLAVQRDVYVDGQTHGSATVEGMESIPCTAPQPASAEQYRELEIESFANAYTVFALVMTSVFRAGDSIVLAGRTYALRYVRRWPDVDGKSAELLLEAV